MSRQKTDHTAFASADAKLCEAIFDKMNRRGHMPAADVYVMTMWS